MTMYSCLIWASRYATFAVGHTTVQVATHAGKARARKLDKSSDKNLPMQGLTQSMTAEEPSSTASTAVLPPAVSGEYSKASEVVSMRPTVSSQYSNAAEKTDTVLPQQPERPSTVVIPQQSEWTNIVLPQQPEGTNTVGIPQQPEGTNTVVVPQRGVVQIPAPRPVQPPRQRPVQMPAPQQIQIPVQMPAPQQIQIPVQQPIQFAVQPSLQVPLQPPRQQIVQAPMQQVVQAPTQPQLVISAQPAVEGSRPVGQLQPIKQLPLAGVRPISGAHPVSGVIPLVKGYPKASKIPVMQKGEFLNEPKVEATKVNDESTEAVEDRIDNFARREREEEKAIEKKERAMEAREKTLEKREKVSTTPDLSKITVELGKLLTDTLNGVTKSEKEIRDKANAGEKIIDRFEAHHSKPRKLMKNERVVFPNGSVSPLDSDQNINMLHDKKYVPSPSPQLGSVTRHVTHPYENHAKMGPQQGETIPRVPDSKPYLQSRVFSSGRKTKQNDGTVLTKKPTNKLEAETKPEVDKRSQDEKKTGESVHDDYLPVKKVLPVTKTITKAENGEKLSPQQHDVSIKAVDDSVKTHSYNLDGEPFIVHERNVPIHMISERANSEEGQLFSSNLKFEDDDDIVENEDWDFGSDDSGFYKWIVDAIGEGTGFEKFPARTPKVEHTLRRRLALQDDVISFFLCMIYLVCIGLGLHLVYRLSANSSSVVFYNNTTFPKTRWSRFYQLFADTTPSVAGEVLICDTEVETEDCERFLRTFTRPPKNLKLRIRGYSDATIEMARNRGLFGTTASFTSAMSNLFLGEDEHDDDFIGEVRSPLNGSVNPRGMPGLNFNPRRMPGGYNIGLNPRSRGFRSPNLDDDPEVVGRDMDRNGLEPGSAERNGLSRRNTPSAIADSATAGSGTGDSNRYAFNEGFITAEQQHVPYSRMAPAFDCCLDLHAIMEEWSPNVQQTQRSPRSCLNAGLNTVVNTGVNKGISIATEGSSSSSSSSSENQDANRTASSSSRNLNQATTAMGSSSSSSSRDVPSSSRDVPSSSSRDVSENQTRGASSGSGKNKGKAVLEFDKNFSSDSDAKNVTASESDAETLLSNAREQNKTRKGESDLRSSNPKATLMESKGQYSNSKGTLAISPNGSPKGLSPIISPSAMTGFGLGLVAADADQPSQDPEYIDNMAMLRDWIETSRDPSESMTTLVIEKQIVWPEWQELCDKITDKIRRSGFQGKVHITMEYYRALDQPHILDVVENVDMKEEQNASENGNGSANGHHVTANKSTSYTGDNESRFFAPGKHCEVCVQRNSQWANFMRNGSTASLVILSIFLLFFYMPYMLLKQKHTTIRTRYKPRMGVDEYWRTIEPYIGARGFRSDNHNVGVYY